MDVRLLRQVFREGRVWTWLATCGHGADIGGSGAGGFSSTTTEVHQEGLRSPPIRICRRGELDLDLLDMILANCRVPEERVGDLKAQLGALAVGERRLCALLDRYGDDVVDQAIEELRDRSEREMRAVISDLPDGHYSGEAIMESDGVILEQLKVVLEMNISGTKIHFD